MLAQINRFRGRGGVKFTMRRGRSIGSSNMRLIYFLRDHNNHPPRVAIVVSKKVSKIAPRRNRIRRRLYSHMESFIQSLPPGLDVVIVVKPNKSGEKGVFVQGLDVVGELSALLAKLNKQIPL